MHEASVVWMHGGRHMRELSKMHTTALRSDRRLYFRPMVAMQPVKFASANHLCKQS
jgi:hypothetical protein